MKRFFFQLTCPVCGEERFAEDVAESSARRGVAAKMYQHLWIAHTAPQELGPGVRLADLEAKAERFFTPEEIEEQRKLEAEAARAAAAGRQLALPI